MPEGTNKKSSNQADQLPHQPGKKALIPPPSNIGPTPQQFFDIVKQMANEKGPFRLSDVVPN